MHYEIRNKEWKIDQGFNLYIDVITKCNAKCAFCIAPSVGRKDGPRLLDGLTWALNVTDRVNGSVQLMGGEPMISPLFQDVMKAIGRSTAHRKVVNTNASFVTEQRINQMKEAGINYLNISRHHWDDMVNQQIMKMKPLLTTAKIEQIRGRLGEVGLGSRLNCCLLKEGVSNYEDVMEFVGYGKDLGFTEIAFSQTFPLGLFDYQVPLELGYTEDQQVDLRAIVRKIDQSVRWEASERLEDKYSMWGKSHWRGGGRPEQGKRRFWKNKNDGVTVSIKTLSGYSKKGIPHETSYSKVDDPELQNGFATFAVVHPDGVVTASWDSRDRIWYQPPQKGA